MSRTMSKRGSSSPFRRTLDARPDVTDFRDRLYSPCSSDVPRRLALTEFIGRKVPILDQGVEGGSTGYALASVAQFLLQRRHRAEDLEPVSARMLSEMARRYDVWPGETYEGTSARGTLKGWRRHGVCAEALWAAGSLGSYLPRGLMDDAERRPLGAYLRIDREDIFTMQSALNEEGILYATSLIHDGWKNPADNGWIDPSWKILGGHSFAIVAYEHNGFWIQNSWGTGWARGGLAFLRYGDWLEHGTDVWVARLGPCPRRSEGRRVDHERLTNAQSPSTTMGWQRRRLLLYVQGGAWARKLQPNRWLGPSQGTPGAAVVSRTLMGGQPNGRGL